MEFIPGTLMRDQIIQQEMSPERKIDLINRAINPLREMYLRGIHHIDYGPHAIILSQDPTQQDTCIDFQYSSFYQRPVPENAVHQAAYFCWSVSTNQCWINAKDAESWFERVMMTLEIEKTKMLYKIFHNSLKVRLPTSQRIAGFSEWDSRL